MYTHKTTKCLVISYLIYGKSNLIINDKIQDFLRYPSLARSCLLLGQQMTSVKDSRGKDSHKSPPNLLSPRKMGRDYSTISIWQLLSNVSIKNMPAKRCYMIYIEYKLFLHFYTGRDQPSPTWCPPDVLDHHAQSA